MRYWRHIDWLSITFPIEVNWRSFLPFTDLSLSGKGRHGYRQAWHDRRTGAVIETASDDKSMGTHITLSGEPLQMMRQGLGMVDDALIHRIEQFDGKVSRIDLAIDCYGDGFTPADLNDAIKSKDAHIRARTWRFIEGHRSKLQGDTLDTGSPKSDVRFRFYDKRAEQRIKDGEAWVRLEMQLRRLYSRTSVQAICEHGSDTVTANTIGAYLEWSHTDYQNAIAAPAVNMPEVPRRDSNRQAWLLGQVAKSLAQECAETPGFKNRFDISLNAFFEEEMKKRRGAK